MARTPTKYTIVHDGDVSTYANKEALLDALAHLPASNVQPLVFAGEPIEFTVDTSPRVTLGETKKPRAKKQKKAKDETVEARPGNGAKKPVFAPHDATDLD